VGHFCLSADPDSQTGSQTQLNPDPKHWLTNTVPFIMYPYLVMFHEYYLFSEASKLITFEIEEWQFLIKMAYKYQPIKVIIIPVFRSL
jgi:hypothetical protein